MTSNLLKDQGFVPGDMSKENYDKIDLHRPYVDYIVLCSESGKPMKRESDLIDVWFDSGSMPYAQVHYPFENAELIDKRIAFPCDFINEGVDQTRGWFFTLHAIATMIFDSVAFKNVISSGLVLDAKGNKMSKHVGNVVNPFDMIDKFDSDAVRLRPFAGERVKARAGAQKRLQVRHLLQCLRLEAEIRTKHPADLGVGEVRKQFLRRLAAFGAEVCKFADCLRRPRREPLLASRHQYYFMHLIPPVE